jgi:hypothetical protein
MTQSIEEDIAIAEDGVVVGLVVGAIVMFSAGFEKGEIVGDRVVGLADGIDEGGTLGAGFSCF